jgi:hypothetical protein
VTEKQWAASTNPIRLLKCLAGKMSARKQRLLCVACCHRVWSLLVHKQCRKAVGMAERYADGKVTEDDLSSEYTCCEDVHCLACNAWQDVGTEEEKHNPFARLSNEDKHAAREATEAVSGTVDPCLGDKDYEEAGVEGVVTLVVSATRGKITKAVAEAALIRDIFGNPFRPVALDPTWLTSDVLALARGIYAKKAFDRMPILADALQDAGCTNEDVLSHCRDTQLTHVRGCWVVDLLLEKR